MKANIQQLVVMLVVVLASVLNTGCSTPRAANKAHAEGAIVVVGSGPSKPLHYITPMEKEDAMEQGLRRGIKVLLFHGGFFVLPLSLGIGAAQGLRGQDLVVVSRAETVLTNAAKQINFPGTLCAKLVELGPGLTGYTWILSNDFAARFSAATNSAKAGHLLLSISILSFGLEPVLESKHVPVNPTLRLRVRVQSQPINLQTGEQFESQIFEFGGGFHKFLTWAENDASELRVHCSNATEALAKKIVDGIFASKP